MARLQRLSALVFCNLYFPPIGLALTLVTVGAAAALSIRHATKRFSWFSTVARRAPYFSSLPIVGVGLYVGSRGGPNSFISECDQEFATWQQSSLLPS